MKLDRDLSALAGIARGWAGSGEPADAGAVSDVIGVSGPAASADKEREFPGAADGPAVACAALEAERTDGGRPGETEGTGASPVSPDEVG